MEQMEAVMGRVVAIHLIRVDTDLAVIVEVEVKREVRMVVTEVMKIQILVTKYTGLDFIYLVKCR